MVYNISVIIPYLFHRPYKNPHSTSEINPVFPYFTGTTPLIFTGTSEKVVIVILLARICVTV